MNFKQSNGLTAAIAGALLACLTVQGAQSAASKKPPNVILILADDLGYGEPGCYGNPAIKTPVMDQLARDGVRCTDGYAMFPVCSPSRAALLTGRFPARIGPAAEDYGTTLDPEKHTTIGQLMKEAGYRTACFGKWNVSNKTRRPANDYGFDRWVGLHLNHNYYTHRLERTGELDMYENGEPYTEREGTWCDTVFADEAIKFVEQAPNDPFFIYLPFQAPHSPFQDPDDPNSKPLDDWQNKPDEGRKRLVKMIERLDLEIGRVMDTLDERGLAENTLVILTSDNGGAQGGGIGRNLPLRGAKQMLEEGGIRVPFILRWPAVLAKGTEFTEPINAMDLTATIAAVGGASARPDQPFDGINLLPALTGSGRPPSDRPFFFRRFTNRSQTYRQSAVRLGDWKFLRAYAGTKQVDALYNLKDDIAETTNLAETNPEKLKALIELHDQWAAEMAKTAAPLPTPKVPPAKSSSSTVKSETFLGWAIKNAEVSAQSDSLRITPTNRPPLLVKSKLKGNGPVEVRLRVRTNTGGDGKMQWRTEGQELFPASGQDKSFTVAGGDWQELSVPLAVEGRLAQLRLFLSVRKQPIDVDWIEIAPTEGSDKERQRWDFKGAADPTKPKPKARASLSTQ